MDTGEVSVASRLGVTVSFLEDIGLTLLMLLWPAPWCPHGHPSPALASGVLEKHEQEGL